LEFGFCHDRRAWGQKRHSDNCHCAPQEQDCARAHGAVPVRFGPRILRTETAGIALISAITALLDW